MEKAADYKKMYYKLLDASEDVIEVLKKEHKSQAVIDALSLIFSAQQECEDIYIESSYEEKVVNLNKWQKRLS